MEYNKKVYETHFELAKRLRTTPARVKRLALQFETGLFGSSGVVFYFPTTGSDMAFFKTMMRARFPGSGPANGS